MEATLQKQNETRSRTRDLANFIKMRPAIPGDDLQVADLVLRTFVSTYEKKLPDVRTTEGRKDELRDVATRRRNGFVGVAELGYQIIGTFALIHPESTMSEAWHSNGATLRCVAIDPDFHGLALSELLLNEADRVAKLWRADAIFLHVQKGAEKVAAIYTKHGYRRDPIGDKISFDCELEGYRKSIHAS